MIHDKKLPKKLWAEAINTAVFVLNRTGKSHEDGRSPFEQEDELKPQEKTSESQAVFSLDLEDEPVQEKSPETDIDEIRTIHPNETINPNETIDPNEIETTHTSSSTLEDNSDSDSDYLPCSDEECLLKDVIPPTAERTGPK
ncbi:uncharacterized protein LOC121736253 [Aricia agestis]|uniref:uncharacterized protein LOC121736253 n=1 Tax=Aricia agestis TaxID=91739 RepID=UPI001C2044E6|nr:uncharacterized protein LOC121736253 [Aricia agestis]